MLNNIKTKNQGFTIVELLIVIVIIAILAAITIVAYNGIQARSRTSAAQSLSNSAVKKLEAWNSIENGYPTHAALIANTGAGTAGNAPEAKLDDTAAVVAYTNQAQTTTAGTYVSGTAHRVIYRQLNSSGGCVWYWDHATGSGQRVLTLVGNATTTACNA